MDFYLYDEFKEMSLFDFCRVCKIPFEGSIEEPRRNDVEGFIDMIAVGETRKVSDARITSIPLYVTLQYLLVDVQLVAGTVETLVLLILLFWAMPCFVITLLV